MQDHKKNIYLILKVLLVLITFLTVFLFVMNYIVMVMDTPSTDSKPALDFMKEITNPAAEVAKMNVLTLGVQLLLILSAFILQGVYKRMVKEYHADREGESE